MGRRPVPGAALDVPGVEPSDDDIDPALWLGLTDGDDVGETDAGLGDAVNRDVPAVAGQDHHDPARTGLGDGWSGGVEACGVGGGERQRAKRLQVAQATGRDAAEISEHVFAAGR